MSSGERSSSGRPSSPSTGGALLRGLLLIAVALLLGVALLGATDETVPETDGGTEQVSSGDLDARRRARDADEAAMAGASGRRAEPTGRGDSTDPDSTEPDGTEPDGTEPDGTDPDDATDATGAAGDDDGEEAEPGAGAGASEGEPGEGDPEGTGDTAVASDADGGASEGEEATEGAGARRTGQVTVLVANGSGVAGRAAEVTEEVGTAGFDTAAPSNVNDGATVPASTVYYARGFEADAAALAETLTPRPQVAELPEEAPVSDLRGAQVLLVVGPDLATD